jgi:hemoglobin
MSAATTVVQHDDEPVFVRIGGAAAVAAAVDGLYSRILADATLAPYFDEVGIEQLKAHQRAFITAALGGPAAYHGRPIADAHRGLDITSEAFGRVVEHLVDTLVALGVDAPSIAQIGDALAPLQDAVVAAPHASPRATST